ncbi:MAG: transcriptional repressor LexA [Clostridia bacterium]|nr:transcriptional repressor LexA [Clostridia bacterium]
MTDNITDKQRQILDFIKYSLHQNGYPPSVREICKAVGFKSTSTVHGHLSKLEENGYIRRDPSKPRAIEVLETGGFYDRKQVVDIPIVGRVTAGNPILAIENIEDTFPLPKDFIHEDNTFILKVQGESMINAGILDNDYVVVKQQYTSTNGDIVVALIDDEEATVKRFYKEKDHIRLQPENPYMDPIIVKDVKILGKVIGVFRKL